MTREQSIRPSGSRRLAAGGAVLPAGLELLSPRAFKAGRAAAGGAAGGGYAITALTYRARVAADAGQLPARGEIERLREPGLYVRSGGQAAAFDR